MLPLAFFSFVVLEDAGPDEHRTYNEWHQLDHRPENLALPGVAWGDRWARVKENSTAAEEYEAVDYIAMYWFDHPLDAAVDAWDTLGSDSFQWGRGPLLPGVRRPFLGFFRPVRGYSSRSALVSPDVLPYRPNRGLHITLTRYDDAHSPHTHDMHRWEDRELIPELLDVDGVAGVWTFAFSHHQRHATMPLSTSTDDVPGSLRMRVVYVDADPTTTAERIRTTVSNTARSLPDSVSGGATTLLDTVATTIIPWQDW